jgi:AcrR family transcriptional regulator
LEPAALKSPDRAGAVAPKIDRQAGAAARPPSARQLERVKLRRRELAELTMQLMREKGFDALSVNELAERASMSIGGLYRYIKTKTDLLEMIYDQINLGLDQAMVQAAASARGIQDKLQAAFKVYWETCWDSAEPILMAYREWQSLPPAARRRYMDKEAQIGEFFGELIRAGVIVDEFRAVDERLLASEMILLAQMRALKGWGFGGRDRSAVFAEHWELIRGRLR